MATQRLRWTGKYPPGGPAEWLDDGHVTCRISDPQYRCRHRDDTDALGHAATAPRTGGPPVTNIRNTSSPHWRAWLKPENRCLVPANSFAEYAPEPTPETKKKDVVWFALSEDRPPFAIAGIWTTFNDDRGTKSKPIPGPDLVYAFLTTTPNAIVEPIHPKAMPVRSEMSGCAHR